MLDAMGGSRSRHLMMRQAPTGKTISPTQLTEAVGPRVSRMHVFISRTAVPCPTKTARETMLWPMFSSAMPAMPATGPTFW